MFGNPCCSWLNIVYCCAVPGLGNAADMEEAWNAALRNKKHLTEMCLNFILDGKVSIDVMKALKPPPKLQSLSIRGSRST